MTSSYPSCFSANFFSRHLFRSRPCVQHSISGALSLLHDNIKCLQNSTSATLKLIFITTSNIRGSTPSSHSTQHPTSHVCNIETHIIRGHLPSSPSTQHLTSHVCDIETQQSQHRKLKFATSKYLDLILKHSHETPATRRECGCNMSRAIAT
jgi:hypothetical protein